MAATGDKMKTKNKNRDEEVTRLKKQYNDAFQGYRKSTRADMTQASFQGIVLDIITELFKLNIKTLDLLNSPAPAEPEDAVAGPSAVAGSMLDASVVPSIASSVASAVASVLASYIPPPPTSMPSHLPHDCCAHTHHQHNPVENLLTPPEDTHRSVAESSPTVNHNINKVVNSAQEASTKKQSTTSPKKLSTTVHKVSPIRVAQQKIDKSLTDTTTAASGVSSAGVAIKTQPQAEETILPHSEEPPHSSADDSAAEMIVTEAFDKNAISSTQPADEIQPTAVEKEPPKEPIKEQPANPPPIPTEWTLHGQDGDAHNSQSIILNMPETNEEEDGTDSGPEDDNDQDDSGEVAIKEEDSSQRRLSQRIAVRATTATSDYGSDSVVQEDARSKTSSMSGASASSKSHNNHHHNQSYSGASSSSAATKRLISKDEFRTATAGWLKEGESRPDKTFVKITEEQIIDLAKFFLLWCETALSRDICERIYEKYDLSPSRIRKYVRRYQMKDELGDFWYQDNASKGKKRKTITEPVEMKPDVGPEGARSSPREVSKRKKPKVRGW